MYVCLYVFYICSTPAKDKIDDVLLSYQGNLQEIEKLYIKKSWFHPMGQRNNLNSNTPHIFHTLQDDLSPAVDWQIDWRENVQCPQIF